MFVIPGLRVWLLAKVSCEIIALPEFDETILSNAARLALKTSIGGIDPSSKNLCICRLDQARANLCI
jgi:hypothetical protein